MLKRLLTIKIRREQKLMSRLNEAHEKIASLEQFEEQLKAAVGQNANEWKQANTDTVIAKKVPLDPVLKHYRQFYEKKNQLEAAIQKNRSDREKLAKECEKLQQDLHKNRIEQEKFKYLIENENTAFS